MTKKPYRLVVFDWEGTLGDPLGQVLTALSDEAEHLHLQKLNENEMRQYIHLGLAYAIKKVFPRISIEQSEQLLSVAKKALTVPGNKINIAPGALEFVEALSKQGIYLAIATNKGHQSLQYALATTSLDQFFQVTRSADQAPAKPSPQMLMEIMDTFAVTPSETLMIGDSVADIEMALNAGSQAIGVDLYHQQEADLRAAGALDVVHNYEQLAVYLRGLECE